MRSKTLEGHFILKCEYEIVFMRATSGVLRVLIILSTIDKLQIERLRIILIPYIARFIYTGNTLIIVGKKWFEVFYKITPGLREVFSMAHQLFIPD